MRSDLDFEDAYRLVFDSQVMRRFRSDLNFRSIGGSDRHEESEQNCKQQTFHSGAIVALLERTGGSCQPEYTTRPPTIVAATLPCRCQPSKGVFFDFERDFAASNVHFFLESKIVTSATQPRVSEPRPRRSKQRAGPAVKSSTIRASGILRSRCSLAIARPSAVSRPVM